MLAYGREGFDGMFHSLFCLPDAFHRDFNSRLLRAEFGIRTKAIQLIRAVLMVLPVSLLLEWNVTTVLSLSNCTKRDALPSVVSVPITVPPSLLVCWECICM